MTQKPALKPAYWLRGGDVRASQLATLLGALSASERVTLEFWDTREPSRRRLHQAGVPLPPDPAGGQPVLESIDRAELPQIVGAVLSESFGLWLGMSEDEVRVAARETTNEDRALALTPEGRFVILSLYDENFEVLARGISDLELAAEVDHAIESVPIGKR